MVWAVEKLPEQAAILPETLTPSLPVQLYSLYPYTTLLRSGESPPVIVAVSPTVVETPTVIVVVGLAWVVAEGEALPTVSCSLAAPQMVVKPLEWERTRLKASQR